MESLRLLAAVDEYTHFRRTNRQTEHECSKGSYHFIKNFCLHVWHNIICTYHAYICKLDELMGSLTWKKAWQKAIELIGNSYVLYRPQNRHLTPS